MKHVTILFAALSGAIATPVSGQDPAASGKAVYAAQKCNACHSIGGIGNRRGALDGVAAKMPSDDLRRWITNAPDMAAKTRSERKPAMRAYTLPQDDLDALVAYLETLK